MIMRDFPICSVEIVEERSGARVAISRIRIIFFYLQASSQSCVFCSTLEFWARVQFFVIFFFFFLLLIRNCAETSATSFASLEFGFVGSQDS